MGVHLLVGCIEKFCLGLETQAQSHEVSLAQGVHTLREVQEALWLGLKAHLDLAKLRRRGSNKLSLLPTRSVHKPFHSSVYFV